MTTVVWNRKLTESVISLYRQHPCLWDQDHAEYQDRDVRDEAFNTIVAAMNDEIEGITVNDIKLKIKSIKSQLRKEIKSIEESMDDGIEPGKLKAPRLWCYDLVEFLVPNIGIVRSTPRKAIFSQLISKKRDSTDDLEDESVSEQSNSKAQGSENIAKRQRIDDDPIKKELDDLRKSLAIATPRRFEWVGDRIVNTLNEMKSEEVIDDCIESIQLVIMKFKKKDRRTADIFNLMLDI